MAIVITKAFQAFQNSPVSKNFQEMVALARKCHINTFRKVQNAGIDFQTINIRYSIAAWSSQRIKNGTVSISSHSTPPASQFHSSLHTSPNQPYFSLRIFAVMFCVNDQ
jgi:hypothetical protein